MKLKEYFLRTPATLTLIVINILIFIALNVSSDLIDIFLLDPDLNNIMNRPWTLLTVFFSHEIHIHILLNLLLIFVFGTQLEMVTNKKMMFLTYILSGFIGNLAILAYAPLIGYSDGPIAGASAAAFGIVAVYGTIKPNNIILKSKSKYWVLALFIVNAILTIQNPEVSIGGPAHATGIVVGLFLGYWYKKRFGVIEV
ncbi:rhomboid family intramembrane serine protease [Bacillus sp. HMF5848]|uniref:rhomboid family intramembrane serine protease n=1 Tax=Bacillus sp. HMF5848 TaxID=2495421 RepID=UPI000F78F137|nr:rhomboid family intramembrane serine protease [Bacillus sp. HMF5848]RSK27599.1 rhomboid family intramembrane serine protease [Bacillus sp. HMF5848]